MRLGNPGVSGIGPSGLLADIIASKQHADRAKDREALPELVAMQRREPGWFKA